MSIVHLTRRAVCDSALCEPLGPSLTRRVSEGALRSPMLLARRDSRTYPLWHIHSSLRFPHLPQQKKTERFVYGLSSFGKHLIEAHMRSQGTYEWPPAQLQLAR